MATAVDGKHTNGFDCSTEELSLLPTVKSCTDEFESVYRAHRMCLPGGVQGNDEIPSAYDYLCVSNLADEIQ